MTEEKSIRSSAFRRTTNIDHREFDPVYEPPKEDGKGWARDDGVKRLTKSGHIVMWKTYRAKVGTLRGRTIYTVGDYVGNRRHILDNNATPAETGSTWQVWLQTDEDDPTSLECYRLCDLEGLPQFGTLVATENDFEPEHPELMVYYREKVPPRPDIGKAVTHKQHGEGSVVKLLGTGETWYASIQYAWPDTHKFPDEGTLVRRRVPGTDRFAYGEVAECADDVVEVEFDNGQLSSFSLKDFYQSFFRVAEYGAHQFYRIFNIPPPPPRRVPKVRRLGADHRTHNQRVFGADSRSSVALSAMSARQAPESGHHVPAPRSGKAYDPSPSFRWHRERAAPPKNEDFAPLVGRPEKDTRPKKGRDWDLYLGVRKRKVTAPPTSPASNRKRPPGSGAPTGETYDINGAPALF